MSLQQLLYLVLYSYRVFFNVLILMKYVANKRVSDKQKVCALLFIVSVLAPAHKAKFRITSMCARDTNSTCDLPD
jgi:hypothetical protein